MFYRQLNIFPLLIFIVSETNAFQILRSQLLILSLSLLGVVAIGQFGLLFLGWYFRSECKIGKDRRRGELY
jgi:hypothetical protein